MAERIVAFCGIICSSCDAYQATQSGDPAELERVAAAWREQFGPDVTAASIVCEGCLAVAGPHCGYCSECPIRACAVDRGVSSCAHCDDFGCDTIKQFLRHAPEMRKTLEEKRTLYLSEAGDD